MTLRWQCCGGFRALSLAFDLRLRLDTAGSGIIKKRILGIVALGGCASQTGVVPNGQGGYLIAKQAATGFPGLGNLKAEAMAEASQYCAGQSREFLLAGATETEPSYVFGNYPRAEISLQCVVPQPPLAKPPTR